MTQEVTSYEEIKNEILGKEFKVLDKGFVRLVDVMGSDDSIVQAARVSYGKGTKTSLEDRGLIRYLMRHKHTTPFEMVEFKFHIKLPIFIARQWIRHRTANVNEYSGRYSEMPDDFYLPDLEQIRPQSTMNKQGRGDASFAPARAEEIRNIMQKTQENLFSEYEDLLGKEFARELARINLPLSNYTEWYWKIDLHNLFHFLRLRIDSHAQYEIQQYGIVMADIVSKIVPHAWEAFADYAIDSIYFSKNEKAALAELLSGKNAEDLDYKSIGLSKREAGEFIKKVTDLVK
jgi:thymidylate synthase (FAD)